MVMNHGNDFHFHSPGCCETCIKVEYNIVRFGQGISL